MTGQPFNRVPVASTSKTPWPMLRGGILGIIVWLYCFYALCILAFFGLLYLYEKHGKQGR